MSAGRARAPHVRGAAVDRKVLDAALDLISRVGLRNVSLERVAKHAGVATTTVYRRYRDTDQLMSAVMVRWFGPPEIPDTGSVREDLIEVIRGVAEYFADPHVVNFAAESMAAQIGNPALEATMRGIWARQRAASRVLIERAVERGELRDDVDVDMALDLISGVVYFRPLVRRVPFTTADAAVAVDTALRGLYAPAAGTGG